MNASPYRLSVTDKIGYGFGDLASNLFWQMFSIFIAKFYTDVFLLGAATMGTMMLVTRVADAFVDPLIGTIADRTHTRWGHFRPYLLWMCLPMAATAVLTFTTPSFGGTARVVYAYVTLTLMMIAYSAINIPYSALLGVLTPDSRDRTSASSYRFVMAFIPIFIIVYSVPFLTKYFGGSENSPFGWQMTMVIYSAAAVFFYLLTFFMTRERVQPEPGQSGSLSSDVGDLLHNRPWVVLCAVGIAALTYSNIRGTVIVYYFDYVVPNGKSYFASVMTTGAVAFIVGVMLTSPLAKRFGKRNFYLASMSLTALLTIAYYFVPPDNIPLVWAGHGLISLCAAPTAPLVWAMYADTADYSEWKRGRRATGLVFSAASFAQKFGWAIGGAGTGWLLAYFGYLPNVAQTPRTVHGIMLMMSVIPAVAAVLAVAALWFYELDEDIVATMGRELAARRGQPSGATAPGAAAAAVAPALALQTAEADSSVAALAVTAAPAARARRHAAATAGSGGVVRPGSSPSSPAFEGAAALPPGPVDPALLDALRGVLAAGVHGLCFSPYGEAQGPGSHVDAAQIRARLAIVRPHTRWIRTFSCTDGHEQTPAIAREMGLKTLVGAWIGTDLEKNARELAGAIEVARAGHADILAIGNEVLLREDLDEDALLRYLAQAREALPGVTIGYVDAYYLFEEHPRVAAACDVILANCYPFWEGCPREQAVAYMQDMVRRATAAAAGKPVIVAETGWPDRGSAFHGAVPSAEGALRYFIDSVRWSRDAGVELFYFAAFDEAWKVGAEGDVGAYWGLWDADGRAKYP
jgi:GPH family glycoside/pentoside/hexuronide:cation symporter